MVSGDSGTEESLSGDRHTGTRSKRASNDTDDVIIMTERQNPG
jgi:hypothetical protein